MRRKSRQTSNRYANDECMNISRYALPYLNRYVVQVKRILPFQEKCLPIFSAINQDFSMRQQLKMTKNNTQELRNKNFQCITFSILLLFNIQLILNTQFFRQKIDFSSFL